MPREASLTVPARSPARPPASEWAAEPPPRPACHRRGASPKSAARVPPACHRRGESPKSASHATPTVTSRECHQTPRPAVAGTPDSGRDAPMSRPLVPGQSESRGWAGPAEPGSGSSPSGHGPRRSSYPTDARLGQFANHVRGSRRTARLRKDQREGAGERGPRAPQRAGTSHLLPKSCPASAPRPLAARGLGSWDAGAGRTRKRRRGSGRAWPGCVRVRARTRACWTHVHLQ